MNMIRRRDLFFPSVAALVLITNFASLQTLPAFSQSQRVESTVVGHGAGAQTKVGKNRLWSELTDSERKAASFLGFDAESWDTDNKVYIDRLTWDELSPAQRKAAKTLSFNKKTWNDEVFVDVYERSWGELTSEQKAAAHELGYSRNSWDRDLPAWSDSKAWRELSSSQQAAAVIIGYTPQEWDDTRRVYEKEWKQLNQVQKLAAEELGYNEKRWNRDKHVFSDDLLWSQLNPRQRWAAKVIGFAEQTWDDATRAGSHSMDSEQARRKELRKRSGESECRGFVDSLQGLFSFGRRGCSKSGKPWYVPDFMGSQSYNFIPPNSLF